MDTRPGSAVRRWTWPKLDTASPRWHAVWTSVPRRSMPGDAETASTKDRLRGRPVPRRASRSRRRSASPNWRRGSIRRASELLGKMMPPKDRFETVAVMATRSRSPSGCRSSVSTPGATVAPRRAPSATHCSPTPSARPTPPPTVSTGRGVCTPYPPWNAGCVSGTERWRARVPVRAQRPHGPSEVAACVSGPGLDRSGGPPVPQAGWTARWCWTCARGRVGD